MPRHMTPEEADDHWTEYGDGGPPPIEDEDDSLIEAVASVGAAQARSPGEQRDGGSSSPKSEDTQPGSADRWAHLEELAQEATPGPWNAIETNTSVDYDTFNFEDEGEDDAPRISSWQDIGPSEDRPPVATVLGFTAPYWEDSAADANAAFIAAANPAAVLELIAAARRERGGYEPKANETLIPPPEGGDTVTVPREPVAWRYRPIGEVRWTFVGFEAGEVVAASNRPPVFEIEPLYAAAPTNTTAGKGPEQ